VLPQFFMQLRNWGGQPLTPLTSQLKIEALKAALLSSISQLITRVVVAVRDPLGREGLLKSLNNTLIQP